MSGKETTDPVSSSWGFAAEEAERTNCNAYFFSNDYVDSAMLGEFGWSIPAEADGFLDFDRTESDLAAVSGNVGIGGLPLGNSAVNADGFSRSIEPLEEIDGYIAEDLSLSSSEDLRKKFSTASASSCASAAEKQPLDTESKVNKKGQKRIQQARFAFVTKSEVDHLEDGYQWRKYGQKSVKNSPFPRSYYKCTNNKCMVKKRVERSPEDPSSVITTYEGQHCHYSSKFPRAGLFLSNFNPHPFSNPTFQSTPQNSMSTTQIFPTNCEGATPK